MSPGSSFSARAATGGLLACVLLVYVAQLILRSGSWRPGLGLSMVVAIGFGYIAWRDGKARPLPGSSVDRGAANTRSPRYALLLFALASLLLAMIVTVVDVHHLEGRVWMLQAAAISVLLSAGLAVDRETVRTSTAAPLPATSWDVSPRTARIVLTGIIALGAWFRFHDLDSLPAGFWFDEADVALIARHIVDDPSFRPVFNEIMPGYHAHIIATLFWLFGESVTAVRAVSAAFGIATIWAGYLAGREIFGRPGGLVLAFLVAFSRWSITLSRIGMHNVVVPFFCLLTLGLVLRGARRRSTLDFVLAGLAAGGGMLFYSAIAGSILALGLLGVILFVGRRQDLAWFAPRMIAATLAMFVVFAPLAKFAVIETDVYLARNRATAIWADSANVPDGQLDDALLDNIVAYAGMAHYAGDGNGRHNLPGEPMLPPLVAGLALLGVGFAVSSRRRTLVWLVVVWLPLSLAPGILSLPWESPNSLRAVAAQPVLLILATAAVVVVGDAVVRSGPRAAVVLLIAGGSAILAAGVADMTTYFGRQADHYTVWAGHSTRETIAAGLMMDAPADTHILAAAYLNGQKTIEFLAADRPPDAFFGSDTPLPLFVPPGKDALILAVEESFRIARQVESLYPNATIEVIPGERAMVLTAIRIPRGDIEASLGWTSEGRQQVGTLVVVDQGDYRFRTADRSVTTVVDGVVAAQCAQSTQPVGLTAGVHRVSVAGGAAGSEPELEWMPPGSEQWTSLPSEALLGAEYLPGGLLGTFYSEPEGPGGTRLTRIDAAIDMRFHVAQMERPFLIEWTGTIDVPATGTYRLRLNTNAESTLSIDGIDVVVVGADELDVAAEVELEKGTWPLRLTYLNRGMAGYIHLLWTPPDGPEQVIPTEVFSPDLEASTSAQASCN